MSNASMGWSVNDAEVMKSFQKMQAENERMRNQLAAIGEQSKRTSDTWAAGLKGVSEEQKRITQGTQAWENAVASLGGRYRTLRDVMMDTTSKGKSTNDVWSSGLRSISEQQRPILEGQEKWRSGLAQLSQQMKATSDTADQLDFQDILDLDVGDIVTGIGAITAGLISVQSATKLVTAEWEDWRQKIDAAKQASQNFHESLIEDLRAAGQLARAEEIDKALSGAKGTTREQMGAAYSGVSKSGPLGVDRSLELTDAMAPLAQAGERPDKLREFGGVMGEVNDLMPGRSADDIGDMTQKLREVARGDFNKFGGAGAVRSLNKLTAAGMAPEDALGWGAAAVDVGVDARTLSQVAGIIGKDMEFKKDSPLWNEVSKLKGLDRFNRLAADENAARAVLGDSLATSFNLIDPATAAKRGQEFRKAAADNLLAQQPDLLRKSQAGLLTGIGQHGESTFDRDEALGANATIEEIIGKIDKGAQPFKGFSDRTIPAMEARIRTYRGALPAEAALEAYGGTQSPEYRAAHSDKENKFWQEEIEMLKALVELQRQAKRERDEEKRNKEPQAAKAPVQIILDRHNERQVLQ